MEHGGVGMRGPNRDHLIAKMVHRRDLVSVVKLKQDFTPKTYCKLVDYNNT